jgi:hypothetical protein
MSGAALGVLTFGSHVVSGQSHAQIHAVCGARSVIVLDRSSVPTVHRPHVLLFAGLSIVRIVPMAGFLKMVLQLFFCVASALTHRAHLLRRRRRMGVLVRAMIPYNLASILVHTKSSHSIPASRKARWSTPTCIQATRHARRFGLSISALVHPSRSKACEAQHGGPLT